MNYLHVYKALSGEWSGIILEDNARIAGCGDPMDVLCAAREQYPGIAHLPEPHGPDLAVKNNSDLSEAMDSLARFLTGSINTHKAVYDKAAQSGRPHDKEYMQTIARAHAFEAWIFWLQDKHPDEAAKLKEVMGKWT